MAGKFSVPYANKVLDKVLRGTDFTSPANVFVALFKSADSTALRNDAHASANEVSGGGYTRIRVRGSGATVTFDAPAAGSTTLSGVITWPSATAAWGTLTFAALMDAETDGNVIAYAALTAPKVIDVGDTARIPVGLLTVSL